MNKLLFAALAALGLLGGGYAISQVITVPQVQSLGQTDLVQVIPAGAPVSGNVYAPAGALRGLEQYSYQVPLTAFSITPPNFTSFLYLNPAGTLASGTVILPATPGDGGMFCLESSQIVTSGTVSANTGQTLAAYGLGALTATSLAANTRFCWMFIRPQAVWVRTV
jgi:hypothetical protein